MAQLSVRRRVTGLMLCDCCQTAVPWEETFEAPYLVDGQQFTFYFCTGDWDPEEEDHPRCFTTWESRGPRIRKTILKRSQRGGA